MQDKDLHYRLQALKDKLIRLVDEKKGNLCDPSVVSVSQEMDRLILNLQRRRLGRS